MAGGYVVVTGETIAATRPAPASRAATRNIFHFAAAPGIVAGPKPIFA